MFKHDSLTNGVVWKALHVFPCGLTIKGTEVQDADVILYESEEKGTLGLVINYQDYYKSACFYAVQLILLTYFKCSE